MSAVVWLASYPKSGNTWMRILIANLMAKNGEPADINDLPEHDDIASSRDEFDDILMLETGLLTHDEAAVLRPFVHEEIARCPNPDAEGDQAGDWSGVRFIKVHDAYTLTRNGKPLLAGARGAKSAIVIVRDPRDIAASLANHYRVSLDHAVAILNDKTFAQSDARESQPPQLRQIVLDWSGFAASWLDQRDIPVHLVRYEDLMSNTAETLLAAMAFAGRPVSRGDAERAAANADFSRLQSQERDRGFREWAGRRDGEYFFRRGAAGGWRDELSAEQVARIEAANAPMMRRLGYELSFAAADGC